MKDVNYGNVVPNLSYFYDEVILPELFTKTIKIERTCKELLEDIENILTLLKSQKSQKSCRMT